MFKASSYYKIQVFDSSNEASARVPLDMADGTKYKIMFSLHGPDQFLTFRPMSDSDGTQLQMGVLMFYITAQDAQKILGFSGDHVFSICTDTGTGQFDSVLFQGNVEWQ